MLGPEAGTFFGYGIMPVLGVVSFVVRIVHATGVPPLFDIVPVIALVVKPQPFGVFDRGQPGIARRLTGRRQFQHITDNRQRVIKSLCPAHGEPPSRNKLLLCHAGVDEPEGIEDVLPDGSGLSHHLSETVPHEINKFWVQTVHCGKTVQAAELGSDSVWDYLARQPAIRSEPKCGQLWRGGLPMPHVLVESGRAVWQTILKHDACRDIDDLAALGIDVCIAWNDPLCHLLYYTGMLLSGVAPSPPEAVTVVWVFNNRNQ